MVLRKDAFTFTLTFVFIDPIILITLINYISREEDAMIPAPSYMKAAD